MSNQKEIWKDIVEYEKRYRISNLGKVKSLSNEFSKKEKLLKHHKHWAGYKIICLCKKGIEKYYRLHRLLAIHFIPNPENKPCINHKNGIKTDNRLENLEWCTYSENNKHAFATGLKKPYKAPSSAEHFCSKKILALDDDNQVIAEYGNARIAAKKLNITFTNISSVLHGRRPKAGGYKWKFL